ncbi:MAG: hypothetical protein ACOC7S_01580 [Planctomycetota bacterium]
MRDPLQTEQTPYEVLGVEPGASGAEVDQAFMAALSKGIPPNKAKSARDALRDPSRRAWYGMLEYDGEALAQFDGSVLKDPSVLEPVRRATTGKRWEKMLKRGFPALPMVHILGVFWYWWAKHEEERFAAILGAALKCNGLPEEITKGALLRQVSRSEGMDCDPASSGGCDRTDCPWRQDCLSSAGPLMEMWEAVTAYWAMRASARDLWESFFGLSEQDVAELQERCVSSLRTELLNLAQRYDGLAARHDGSAGLKARADQYRALELRLKVEVKTARSLAEEAVRTKHGKLACGTLMLQRMGMLDAARSQVETALGKRPSSKRLRRLRDMLSPYSVVAALLDQKKPQAALEAIDELPAKEQHSKEVRKLRARALHKLAMQRASLDRPKEALEAWRAALKATRGGELEKEIRKEIVTQCHAQAVRMQTTRPDGAIGILEEALELEEDDKLRAALGELLADRGISLFLEGQKKTDRMPPGVSSLVREANDAAGREDWDTAVECLRKALSRQEPGQGKATGKSGEGLALCKKGIADLERAAELGSAKGKQQLEAGRSALESIGQDWRAIVEKNLATSLANRAVSKADRAGDLLGEDANAHNKKAEAFLELLKEVSSGSIDPNTCAMPGCYNDATHVMAPSGSLPLPLCTEHVEEVKRVLASPEPSQEAIDLLLSAADDLEKAFELDPESEHISKHLKGLRELLSSLEEATGRSLVPSGRKISSAKATKKRAATKRRARRPSLAGKTGEGIVDVFKGYWWVAILTVFAAGLPGLAAAVGGGVAVGIIVGFVRWAQSK